MDNLENQNVCSVRKENNMGYYRIHTIWSSDGFCINVASKEGAWAGEMTPENVRTTCKELDTDPTQYLAECKEVLTSDDGKKGYSYTIENGCFIWKKMIDEDSGIKVRMGSVLVKPVSFIETIQNIVDVSLNCKKNLQKQLNICMKQKNVEQERVSQLHNKLEELIKEKNIMETDLYSKFLLLLNTKKRKIKELEDSLIVKGNLKEIKLLEKKNANKDVADIDLDNLNAYEVDTEDDDDDDDDKEKIAVTKQKSGKSSYLKKKRSPRNLSSCKEISENVVNISSQKLECNVDINECIPPKKISDLRNRDLQNAKEFPGTKSGILDFFFGTEDQDT